MGEKEIEVGCGTPASQSADRAHDPQVPPESERRRFVKASLAAAPVVLTVISRPLLGKPGGAAATSGSSKGS